MSFDLVKEDMFIFWNLQIMAFKDS